ncbi:hypothetical protein GF345_04175 [Candidatus Woesearchaeota archaeon]|nr:hypothetical protein [Candidatus Woesearchaeota archaeon]
MGWISSLFRKKKDVEAVSIDVSELSQWFDERTEPLLGNIKEEVQQKIDEIKQISDEARESARALESASLRNDKIPERAIQVMEGNRQAYLRSVSLFLDQLKTPTAINIGNINDFLSRFEENLDHFTKTSSRSYYVLQEFFKDESGTIAHKIKKIDAISRSLLDNDYMKLNRISERIEEIKEALAAKKKAEDLIQDEKAHYNSINALKRDTEDKIEKLEQSRDFKDLKQIEDEKERVKDQIKKNEAELISLFSPVEKSMKKYSKMSVEGEQIINAYLDSFLKGLLKDENLLITDVLRMMKQSVENDQLDLKDRKKEKTLEALDLITRDRLKHFTDRHYELVDQLDKLKRREGINTASQKLSELNYKLSHVNTQLERSAQNIEKLEKQLDKPILNKLVEEVQDETKDLLSLDLNVKTEDENAQEPV